MTARRVHSKSHAKRAAKPRSDPYGVAVPEGLHEAIETERDNLSKAESLLGCLAISLEQASAATGPYFPDVAELARSMVRRSINGLDCVSLQETLRNKVKEDFSGGPCSFLYGSPSLPMLHAAG